MYTEEDLRATLGALEEEAPSPAAVLAGIDRSRRRRVTRHRTLGMVAAAALVAVVAAGSVMATNAAAPQETGGSASPHLERLGFPFSVDEIPGYQVAYRFVNVTRNSSAKIGTPANLADPYRQDDSYSLEVFQKGTYDPAPDLTGEPVRVNGKRGYYRLDMRCQCSSEVGIPGVVWEYAPDSWALVQYQKPTAVPGAVPPADVREVSLRIAEAVRFDRRAPVLVPFRLGHLPEGLVPGPEPASMYAVVGGSRGTVINLVGQGRALHIVGLQGIGTPPVGNVTVGETPDGRPTVSVDLGDVGLQLSGTGFSVEELEEIARSATAAPDLHDPATWFDARNALPLH